MTTENVAILFTDLVGSTDLAQHWSPDVGDEIRRGHFSLLRQAIAGAGGTEVKNLGDGLMVVFSSASASISCAVAMQQAVERDNRGRGHQLGLRIGVSGGEVTREDADYFGDPVIEAARLCALSQSGQILAADVVRAMAGRRSRHALDGVGPLVLKGLTEPVETVEVQWAPLGGSSAEVPLPNRLASRPSVSVVGRSIELESMAGAVKRSVDGEGSEVLLVSGEAGVGKSTLVGECARSAFDGGACVLFGHCEEDLATPYRLFAEALDHLVTNIPEDELLAHVEANGSVLSRLVPALASRLPGLPPAIASDADTERYLLFGAVVDLLARASSRSPVILVFDDLQWADNGSLLLLRHIVSTGQLKRLLVLGTYRDSELSYSHALLDAMALLHRQNTVSRIELTGLDDTGVVSLMEAAAGHALDSTGLGLAHAVFRETDGNPFFVREIMRHLSETGAIYQDETGRWVAASHEDTPLPDSLRVVIGGRVGRLGEHAERVLSQAAVIGQDFDLDLLVRCTGSSEELLLDVLDKAVRADLVREQLDPPGQFRFVHALIQRTLYEDLGPTRRALAHRRVGEALERIVGDRPGPRIGELAHHWFSATQPIDVRKAIEYSRQAAEAALALLAPDEAVHYFSQALQLLAQEREPDPLLEVDLLIGLGSAQRQAGMPTFRDTLLDAADKARPLEATDRMVVAALANNRGLFTSLGAVDTRKVEVLTTVLDAMPPDDSNERALLLATLCNELTYGRPLEERRALAHEAKEMARRLSDPATIVQVLNLVEQPLEALSTLEERMADAIEALALAERLEDPYLLYFASVYRRINAMVSGDFDTATRCLGVMRSLSERLRQPILMWITKFHEASEALVFGDHELAEALSTEALQIGTDCGQPDAVSFYGSQMVIVRHQQGRLGELLSIVQAVASETGMDRYYNGALAIAHLGAGDKAEALALLESAAADGFASLPVGIGWMEATTAYAEVAIDLDHKGAAAHLFRLFAPHPDQMGFNGLMPLEPVALYLGGLASVLGRYEQAERYFIEAGEFTDQIDARFCEARRDLFWGEMLSRRGDPKDAARARELLARAHAAAGANGYGSVERRAASALQGVE
jgi:class 3 adenylate cyclase/tetratricopeptide (TPR) repeat protein